MNSYFGINKCVWFLEKNNVHGFIELASGFCSPVPGYEVSLHKNVTATGRTRLCRSKFASNLCGWQKCLVRDKAVEITSAKSPTDNVSKHNMQNFHRKHVLDIGIHLVFE